MKATELKTGMAIRLDGRLLMCVATEHVKPGKGPAYVQAKLRDVAVGGITEKRFGSADTIEGVTLDRRTMEFLYKDGDGAVFMDTETYDQSTLPDSLLGDTLLYLAPNTSCTVLFNDEKPISIDLPASVELTVADTTPVVKGATATNQLKEATCDTGLKVRVPPFIEMGERIKISTADHSYLGRVKAE